MRRRPALLAIAAAALAACRDTAPPPGADIVATARGGDVRRADVEHAILSGYPEARESAPDEVLPRYRTAAEALVAQRVVLADVQDRDKAIRDMGSDYERLQREAVLQIYVQSELRPGLRLTPKDVEGYFKAHPAEFSQQAMRFVWHLFRRDEDPQQPGKTLELLASLKRRAAAGESFRALARQYSQSESRVFDGRLGPVVRGRLPKALESVVFALGKGEISDPVPVPGGAVLFHVSEAMEEKQFPLEDVRLRVAARLAEQRLLDRIAETVKGREAPPGSVVLDAESLTRTLSKEDDSEPVLEVAGFRMTAKDLQDAFAKSRQAAELTAVQEPSIRDFYQAQVDLQLLYLKISAEGFADAPARQAVVRERVRRLGTEQLARTRIEERMRKRAERDAAALERFYDDNEYLYQRPLRLKLRSFSVPAGRDAAARAAQMESVREALVGGKIGFDAAAAELGASVKDLGWLGPRELSALEPKVRGYVLQLNSTGFTIPFQLNRMLTILQVQRREDPRALPYEEVRDRVVKDYYDRSQQQLYRAVVDEILREEAFRFHEEAVKKALSLASP